MLQFPLAQGISEDSNPKAQPASSLARAVNVRFPKAGTLGKRFGTQRLATGQGITTRLLIRGQELAAIYGTGNPSIAYWDSQKLAFSDPSPDFRRVSEVQLDWDTITDATTGVAQSDIGISGDYLIHAWVTGDPTRTPEATPVPATSGVGWVQIRNWRNGSMFMAPALLPVAASKLVTFVRVFISGSNAFVIYSSTEGRIFAQALDLGALSVSSNSTLVTDLRVSTLFGRFDALKLASGDVAVVYENTSPSLVAKRFTVSGATLSSAATVTLSESLAQAIAIVEDPSHGLLYILYGHDHTGSGNYRVRIRSVVNTTMASSLAPVTVQDVFLAYQVSLRLVASSGRPLAMWSGVNQTFPGPINVELNSAQADNTGAIVAGTSRRSASIEMVSQPFQLPNSSDAILFYARDAGFGENAVNPADLQNSPTMSTYLLAIDPGVNAGAVSPPHRYVGKIDHDIGGAMTSGLVPQVVNLDLNTALAVVPYQATAPQSAFNWRCGLRLVRATVDFSLWADPYRSINIGQEAYIAGCGVLTAWDGRSTFDYGMRQPTFPTSNIDFRIGLGPGNGKMAPGTYIYAMTAAFRSQAGVLHRGPVSRTAIATTANANSSLTIIVNMQSIDCKQTVGTGFGQGAPLDVTFDLFRTQSNGATLYQLSFGPRFNVIVNDPTASAVNYVDTSSDADVTADFGGADVPTLPNVALNTRPEPYAVEELEDCQPPAPWTILFHRGRIFVVTGSRREIWYSKDVEENGPGVAPGFNPAQLEIYEEDITGLASMETYRIVFWEGGIWYVTGDGPDVQGLNNTFAPPQAIPSPVGCTNPRSIVETPMGVIFQSEEDLYLLQRDLTVTWIGREAVDTLHAYPIITSAVVVPAQNEVRFTCNNEAQSSGLVLVFDYLRKAWSTRTYQGQTAIADAIMWNDTYVFIDAEAVRQEDTRTHLDALQISENPLTATFVQSDVTLSAITPAGPIGWQRVRIVKLLGESLSNHDLTIQIGRDFGTTYEQTETFPAGSAVTAIAAHARAEVALTVQRRQAVELRFTDAAPADTATYPLGNGAGFQFEGVALLVQPKQGLPKDTATRRGG